MPLKELLATAYHTDQVRRDHGSAVADLKKAFADDPMLRIAALEEQEAVNAVLRVRGRRSCHIQAVMSDLLAESLVK